jgi:GTP-binding protein
MHWCSCGKDTAGCVSFVIERHNTELRRYDDTLTGKPQLVVLTKIDVPEVRDQIDALTERFAAAGYQTMAVSAVTGEGLKELVTVVGNELDRLCGED